MSDDLQKLCEALNKEKPAKEKSEINVIGAAILALAVVIILVLASFGVGIWIMISGWGLSPQSWGVIIGGFIIQTVIMVVTHLITKIFKD